ncbi:MAG: hypothetical protein OSB09_10680 [Planctomycetota bacterium]|nr:hypothetical protein [Planctomycetota bacterium]
MNWPILLARLLKRLERRRSRCGQPVGGAPFDGILPWLSPIFLSAALLILTGCSTPLMRPQATSVSEISREKDVYHFMVSIEDSVPEQDFLLWSRDHLVENNFQFKNPEHEGIPIYELHYHFIQRGDRFRRRRIAYLMWRRSEEDPHQFEHQFTYIGSGVPLRNWRSW